MLNGTGVQVSYPDIYISSWFPAWPCCSCFCKPKRLMRCTGSYFLRVQSYPTLQSLHDVSELGECRPWRAETGVTHSPLSCFWQSHDNNLVVTLLVCVLWTGLLMMTWAGGAHLYCFKKHLCLDISALCLPCVCTTLVWERAQPEKHKRTFLAPPPGHELQSVQVWGVFLSHSAPCEHTVACSGLRLLCPHVLCLCLLLSSQSIFISDYGPKIEAIPRQAGQLLREFWSLLCTMEACLLQSSSGRVSSCHKAAALLAINNSCLSQPRCCQLWLPGESIVHIWDYITAVVIFIWVKIYIST